MTAPAPAPRPVAPAEAWTRTRLPSGTWRLEHASTRSIVILGRKTPEPEVARRFAEAEAVIKHPRGARA